MSLREQILRRDAGWKLDACREVEKAAREVNEEDWEPMRGMRKVRCEDCLYWFATPVRRPRERCPDCEIKLKALARKLARQAEAGPEAEA